MAAFDASLFTRDHLRFRSSVMSGWHGGSASGALGLWGRLISLPGYLESDCPGASECEYISRDIDEDTGMHIVRPSSVSRNPFSISVISLDLIVRAAHLIPVFGTSFIPTHMRSHQSLNAFQAFYVNKFVDHHTFELLQ